MVPSASASSMERTPCPLCLAARPGRRPGRGAGGGGGGGVACVRAGEREKGCTMCVWCTRYCGDGLK